MNASLILIVLSLTAQILATAVAARLLVRSDKKTAAVFMLLLALLLTVRRVISLYRVLEGTKQVDLQAELVACLLSFLLLGGYAYLSRLISSLQQEIDEHTRAEDRLHEINMKLQALLMAMPDAVFFKDACGRYVAVNRAFEEYAGVKGEALIGRTDADVLPGYGAECLRPSDEEIMKSGAQLCFEDTITGADGVKRWFETVKVPLFDRLGDLVGLLSVSREVTDRKKAEKELRASEEKIRTIFNSARDSIVMLDDEGKISLWNPAAEEMFGYSRLEVIGKDMHSVIAPERYHGAYKRGFDVFRTSGKGPIVGKTIETEARRKNGAEFSVEISLANMRINDLWAAVGIIRDVTERKEAEHRLRAAFLQVQEERAKSDAVIATIGDGLVILDNEFKVVYENEVMRKMIGDLVGKVCYKAGEGRDTVCDNCPVELSFRDGLVHRVERTRITEAATFSLDITSSPLRDAAGNIIAVVELARDNTEKKRAEEALRRSHEKLEMIVQERTAELSAMNEQLRDLSSYLQKAMEEERTRIAREIHDDLGQSLTALKIDLALLEKRLLPDRQRAMELLSSMGELVDATIQSVKRISMDLRPGVLDHLGLCAAIEWQAKDFQERAGISCDVILEVEDTGLDRDRATTVFRVLQETLTNIARHARATKATVRLRKGPEGLMLHVADNGIGITEKQLSDPKSLGLIGMRERVYSWGGSLSIGEGRNKGTVVTVEIPLNSEEKST